jgi:hypothetical protein
MIITKGEGNPDNWVTEDSLVLDFMRSMENVLLDPQISEADHKFLDGIYKWVEKAGRYSQKQMWAFKKIQEKLDLKGLNTDLFDVDVREPSSQERDEYPGGEYD